MSVRQKQTKTIPPVEFDMDLKCAPQRAFEGFTKDIAQWWPLDSHSVGGASSKGCVFEAKVGGRIYEILPDGTEADWGSVLEYSAPRLLRYNWHPGQEADQCTEVIVTFSKTPSGTHMKLLHIGWEIHGDRAESVRENYDTGWQHVAGKCFRSHLA